MDNICDKCHGERGSTRDGKCICGTALDYAADRKYAAMYFNLKRLYDQVIAERDGLREKVNHAQSPEAL